MKRFACASAILCLALSTSTAHAEDEPAEKPLPRRSIPLMIVGASGVSAGLTMVATSAIFAATQPCITFPGVQSACDPQFDNTYAAPLLLAGGALAVFSLPVLSIGLERDRGPLEPAQIELAPTRLAISFH